MLHNTGNLESVVILFYEGEKYSQKRKSNLRKHCRLSVQPAKNLQRNSVKTGTAINAFGGWNVAKPFKSRV